ncbi:MAG: molecular chaperone DnaK [Planctomycetota bacterium]|nr:molecular chaperone DnaK [Planctomycetota bacterium]
MTQTIGIDLGTTNSVAAYMKDGRPEIIPNLEGEALTPSVVAFARDQRRWVGRVAKAQAVANPLRTVFSIKRQMGRVAPEAGAGEQIVSSIKRHMGSDHVLTIDGRAYTPVDISAMILEKLKADAQAYLGRKVERAVVTVPAYFNDGQRRATRDAAALAGLEVVRLVNEPTAAALAYGLDIEQAHTILVWDLGGGTFDVSVLELGDGVFEVKAVNGNTRLGGDDYDERMAALLAERFAQQWQVDLTASPESRRMLRDLAERAKIRLSTEAQAPVTLPRAFGRGARCEVTVTREAFEAATADLTEQLEAPARAALADAGIDPVELDRVVLVGGMTRVPAVRRLVRRITGLEPYGHIDPDQVVALGAAVQAGVLDGGLRHVTLVDVTPLSLGIETLGGLFGRVIDRNTPIPTSRSRLFTNARDNQTVVDVHVLQGERELAADNMTLGTFSLSDITPQPRGEAKIEVAFDIDANGIIHVLATDLQTDASRRILVEPAGAPRREEIEAALAESRARMDSDRRRREEIEAGIRAENLLRAADDMLGKASGTESVETFAGAADVAAAAVREALAGGNGENIGVAAKELENCLKALQAALRKAAAFLATQGQAA